MSKEKIVKLLEIPKAPLRLLTDTEMRVGACIHHFKDQKIEPEYISVLTSASLDEVEQALYELGKRDLLPSIWTTN